MTDKGDDFGGTTLTDENGEQMDPALAGISPPSSPMMQGDASGAAVSADLEDRQRDDGKSDAYDEQTNANDVEPSTDDQVSSAVDGSEARPS